MWNAPQKNFEINNLWGCMLFGFCMRNFAILAHCTCNRYYIDIKLGEGDPGVLPPSVCINPKMSSRLLTVALTLVTVGFSLSLAILASPFTTVSVSSGMVKMISIKMIPAERSKRCQSCTFWWRRILILIAFTMVHTIHWHVPSWLESHFWRYRPLLPSWPEPLQSKCHIQYLGISWPSE